MNGDIKNEGNKNIIATGISNSTVIINTGQTDDHKKPSKIQKYYPLPFPSATRFFTAREDVLENIKAALEKTKRASLHDISGIGKTSVVLRFAALSRETYDYIFFLKPNDIDFLKEVWENAEELGFQLPREATPDDKIAEFRQWLATHQKWLVIFDNVTDVKKSRDFIHNLNNGHFLFTSNLREAENLGSRVEIKKFEDADSRTLLYRRGSNSETAEFEDAAPQDREAINKIAREFDGLPLALNICGSFIAEGQMSFTEFSHDVFEHQDEWDDYSFLIDNVEYKSFGKVFELTYKKLIEKENKAEPEIEETEAVEILFLAISLLAPTAIPQEILTETLKMLDERHARFAADENAWINFRKNLTRYDLLQFKPGTKTFETHRLIQKAVEKQFTKPEKLALAEGLLKVLVYLFPEDQYRIWDNYGKYANHCRNFLKNIEELNIENETIAILYNQVGFYFNQTAQYEELERIYKKSLEIRLKVFGENHPSTSKIYNNLGMLYYLQGRYQEAEPLYKKDLAITETVLGENHPETAGSYNNLAALYQLQGRFGEAEPLYKKALQIRETALGEDHSDTAQSYNNLGMLYYSQGRFGETEPLYKKALAIYEKVLGKNHPDTAMIYNNLALLYFSQGRYQEAEQLFKQALVIHEKVLGENHPSTAKNYMNLGVFYFQGGQAQAGLELCEKALLIYRNILPAGHPDIQLCERWIEKIKSSMSE